MDNQNTFLTLKSALLVRFLKPIFGSTSNTNLGYQTDELTYKNRDTHTLDDEEHESKLGFGGSELSLSTLSLENREKKGVCVGRNLGE